MFGSAVCLVGTPGSEPVLWRKEWLPKRVFRAVNVTVGGCCSFKTDVSSSAETFACRSARRDRRLSNVFALPGDNLFERAELVSILELVPTTGPVLGRAEVSTFRLYLSKIGETYKRDKLNAAMATAQCCYV